MVEASEQNIVTNQTSWEKDILDIQERTRKTCSVLKNALVLDKDALKSIFRMEHAVYKAGRILKESHEDGKKAQRRLRHEHQDELKNQRIVNQEHLKKQKRALYAQWLAQSMQDAENMRKQHEEEIRERDAKLLALREELNSIKWKNDELQLRKEDYENRIVYKSNSVRKIDQELQSERGAHVKLQNEMRKQQRLEIQLMENDTKRRTALLKQHLDEVYAAKTDAWRSELEDQTRRGLVLSVQNRRLRRIGVELIHKIQSGLYEVGEYSEDGVRGWLRVMDKELSNAREKIDRESAGLITPDASQISFSDADLEAREDSADTQVWRPTGLTNRINPERSRDKKGNPREGQNNRRSAADDDKDEDRLGKAQMDVMLKLGEELMELKDQVLRLTEDVDSERKEKTKAQKRLDAMSKDFNLEKEQLLRELESTREKQGSDMMAIQKQEDELQSIIQERDELKAKLADTEELQGTVSNLYFALVAETQEDGDGDESKVQDELQQVKAALEMKALQMRTAATITEELDQEKSVSLKGELEGRTQAAECKAEMESKDDFPESPHAENDAECINSSYTQSIESLDALDCGPANIISYHAQTQTDPCMVAEEVGHVHAAPHTGFRPDVLNKGVQAEIQRGSNSFCHRAGDLPQASSTTGEVVSGQEEPNWMHRTFEEKECQTRVSALTALEGSDGGLKKRESKEIASIEEALEELLYFEQVAFDEHVERVTIAKQLEEQQASMQKQLEMKDAQIQNDRKLLAKHFSKYLQQLRRSWQKSRQSSDDIGIKKLYKSVDTMASALNEDSPATALEMLAGSIVQYTSTGTQTLVRLPQSAWSDWKPPKSSGAEEESLMITSTRSLKGGRRISLSVDIPTESSNLLRESGAYQAPVSYYKQPTDNLDFDSDSEVIYTPEEAQCYHHPHIPSSEWRDQEAAFLSLNSRSKEVANSPFTAQDLITEGESPGPWGHECEQKPMVTIQMPSSRSVSSDLVTGETLIRVETRSPRQTRRLTSAPPSWREVLHSFRTQNEKVKETSSVINMLSLMEQKRRA